MKRRAAVRSCRTRTGTADSERGSVALFMALFTVALLAMAGLVIDGGAALAVRGHAHDVAEQAARAGADALSPLSLRSTSPGGLALDPIGARSAAERYLSFGDATGNVEINGQTVTVTAHVPHRAVVLSAFGVDDVSGTATASATILHGTTTGAP